MKELLSFLLVLLYFTITYTVLYTILLQFNIIDKFSGILILMVYSLPLIGYIAFATTDKPKEVARSFATIAICYYSVLLACLGLTVLI